MRQRQVTRRVCSVLLGGVLLASASIGLLYPRTVTAEGAIELAAITSAPPPAPRAGGHRKPDLFLRLQPYFTRDPLVAARSPLDAGGYYQRSPLDPTPRIYGLGVIVTYEVTSWLQFTSAYRLNLSAPTASGIGTAAHARDTLSHALFFGISVPFSPPPP